MAGWHFHCFQIGLMSRALAKTPQKGFRIFACIALSAFALSAQAAGPKLRVAVGRFLATDQEIGNGRFATILAPLLATQLSQSNEVQLVGQEQTMAFTDELKGPAAAAPKGGGL